MNFTYQTARKEMFAFIDANWTSIGNDLFGELPELRYQGAEKPGLPGAANYWGRASTQTVKSSQTAFIMPDGPGQSPAEFETHGLLYIQMFAPMKDNFGYSVMELFADRLQRCFMGAHTDNGVWFKNPRVNELPNDATFYRWNVIAEFTYNQVQGT